MYLTKKTLLHTYFWVINFTDVFTNSKLYKFSFPLGIGYTRLFVMYGCTHSIMRLHMPVEKRSRGRGGGGV